MDKAINLKKILFWIELIIRSRRNLNKFIGDIDKTKLVNKFIMALKLVELIGQKTNLKITKLNINKIILFIIF